MSEKETLVTKCFDLSNKLMELYAVLIKENEFDLSSKLLKSGLMIREHVEDSFALDSIQDQLYKISLATQEAIQTRYWLKLLQMKHFVNSSCDESVNQINEIINILIYMGKENTSSKILIQYQLN